MNSRILRLSKYIQSINWKQLKTREKHVRRCDYNQLPWTTFDHVAMKIPGSFLNQVSCIFFSCTHGVFSNQLPRPVMFIISSHSEFWYRIMMMMYDSLKAKLLKHPQQCLISLLIFCLSEYFQGHLFYQFCACAIFLFYTDSVCLNL